MTTYCRLSFDKMHSDFISIHAVMFMLDGWCWSSPWMLEKLKLKQHKLVVFFGVFGWEESIWGHEAWKGHLFWRWERSDHRDTVTTALSLTALSWTHVNEGRPSTQGEEFLFPWMEEDEEVEVEGWKYVGLLFPWDFQLLCFPRCPVIPAMADCRANRTPEEQRSAVSLWLASPQDPSNDPTHFSHTTSLSLTLKYIHTQIQYDTKMCLKHFKDSLCNI